MKKCVLLFLLVAFAPLSFIYAQTSGTITVGGDITKWYPVSFSDSTGWSKNFATELEIGRSEYHRDGSAKGSMIARFRYHTSNWGNGSNFMDVDLRQAPGAYYVFIAGWRDAAVSNSTRRFLVWLRGGTTTYSYQSNYAVNPLVYDDVQNALPYQEPNGPSHSYKTTIDPYVNSYGMTYNNSAYFNGTTQNYFGGSIGVGTDTALAKLHVDATQGTVFGKFTQSNVLPAEGFLDFSNGTLGTGSFIPNIVGRAKTPGRPLGLYITGQAEDIVPSGTDAGYAAVVLDGRTKTASALTKSNVLAIANAGQNLVTVQADGDVGIGTTDTKGYKLAVNGSAIFTRAKVEAYANWPDYVFERDYSLMSLSDLAKYINENKHLPDMPSADEVAKDGFDLGDMNKKLLQKIEELTLYLIDLKKENSEMKQQHNELLERMEKLEKK
ncbi:hypothetical protein [Chitinophaga sp. GbtcB8]|uniref:hypothetical protein n=1 Tax=Chitinophaga sp. GbtcB8 TaxID=2824753 RepID=UPI001C307488|nr:hypothetical protein [Chitinophaga sp. GbtcB8]